MRTEDVLHITPQSYAQAYAKTRRPRLRALPVADWSALPLFQTVLKSIREHIAGRAQMLAVTQADAT